MKNYQFYCIITALLVINTNMCKGFDFDFTVTVPSAIAMLIFTYLTIRSYISDKFKE